MALTHEDALFCKNLLQYNSVTHSTTVTGQCRVRCAHTAWGAPPRTHRVHVPVPRPAGLPLSADRGVQAPALPCPSGSPVPHGRAELGPGASWPRRPPFSPSRTLVCHPAGFTPHAVVPSGRGPSETHAAPLADFPHVAGTKDTRPQTPRFLEAHRTRPPPCLCSLTSFIQNAPPVCCLCQDYVLQGSSQMLFL